MQRRFHFQMEVASLDRPGDPWLNQIEAQVHALGPGTAHYGFTPRWVPWVKENAHRFDAVIINGLWQFHSLGTWLSLRGADTPYFVFPHGMLDRWFAIRYRLKHVKKLIYWNLVEHRVLRDAQAVLFTSNEECAAARNTFKPYHVRETVIGMGLSGPPANQSEIEEEFFALFPQLKAKPYLLFLGRLHAKKGVDLLISAFDRMSSKYTDIQLVIAGPDGDCHNELRSQVASLSKQVQERIIFTGMLGKTKWAALKACQALVLPSHQENFGLVVPEALACEAPVLISNKVNIWKAVQEEQAGLVAEDDLAGTEKILDAFLALSQEDKLKMKHNARRLFLGQFESSNFFPEYLALLSGNNEKAGAKNDS